MMLCEQTLKARHLGDARAVLPRGESQRLSIVRRVEHEGRDATPPYGLVARIEVDGDEHVRLHRVRKCRTLFE